LRALGVRAGVGAVDDAGIAVAHTYVVHASFTGAAARVYATLCAEEKRRYNTFLIHGILCEAHEEHLHALVFQPRGLSTQTFIAEEVRVAPALVVETDLLANFAVGVLDALDGYALARQADAGSIVTRVFLIDRRVNAVSSAGVAHAVVALGVIFVTDIDFAEVRDDACAVLADTGLILAGLAIEVGLLAASGQRVALVGDAFAEVVAGDV
jgi:hypothetical protein